MSSPKVVLVGRFEVPTQSVPGGGPEHKIQHDFTADGVRRHAVFPRVNPLRANPEHKLHFLGKGPRLLEQKISIPFSRVTAEERRDTGLKL